MNARVDLAKYRGTGVGDIAVLLMILISIPLLLAWLGPPSRLLLLLVTGVCWACAFATAGLLAAMVASVRATTGPDARLTADDPIARAEAHRRRHDWLRDAAGDLTRAARDAAVRHDEALADARPTFPTSAQVAGIHAALAAIRARDVPPSHHGVIPLPGAPVQVHGERGWLRVVTDAPYLLARRGSKAWDFTDAELVAILGVIEDEGFVVAEHWRADSGVSIIATPAAATVEADR